MDPQTVRQSDSGVETVWDKPKEDERSQDEMNWYDLPWPTKIPSPSNPSVFTDQSCQILCFSGMDWSVHQVSVPSAKPKKTRTPNKEKWREDTRKIMRNKGAESIREQEQRTNCTKTWDATAHKAWNQATAMATGMLAAKKAWEFHGINMESALPKWHAELKISVLRLMCPNLTLWCPNLCPLPMCQAPGIFGNKLSKGIRMTGNDWN